MKVYNSIDEFATRGVNKTLVTTGTFDGVHLGHRAILKRIAELSKDGKSESVLLTFNPHPRTILFPDGPPMQFLSTFDEKKALLAEAGVSHLIVHPFTKELSRVSALDYVRNVLSGKLHVQTLVIGHDHRFGRNREGSIKELKEWAPTYGFEVEEISPFKLNDITISSSKIRKAIAEGDLTTANNYLGYIYSIQATVVHGLKLGSTELGYPTANLEVLDKNKIIPADGIYAVYVNHDGKKYRGMMSIGLNPTVEGKGRSMEVNIFDFNNDIYGKELSVSFFRKIRNEEKFDNLDALKQQLHQDKEISIRLLS